MKIHLLFQSLLESVHDTVYITNLCENTPSLTQCYCVWLDSTTMTLVLKNQTIRHTIKWDMSSGSLTYNDHPQGTEFLNEVVRILQCVSKDMIAGRAQVYKNHLEVA